MLVAGIPRPGHRLAVMGREVIRLTAHFQQCPFDKGGQFALAGDPLAHRDGPRIQQEILAHFHAQTLTRRRTQNQSKHPVFHLFLAPGNRPRLAAQ
jgi:hypothetical protein